MRRRTSHPDNRDDDPDDDAWDEGDSWDDDSDDQDSDADTVPCPYCRQPVYEDADYCANCEEYISLEDSTPERKPTWMIVTTLLLLLSIWLSWVLWMG